MSATTAFQSHAAAGLHVAPDLSHSPASGKSHAFVCCRADPIHQATRKPADANPVTPFRPVNPPKKGGPGTVTRNFGGRAKGACGEFEWKPRGDDTDQTSASSGGTDAAATGAAAAGTAFRPSAYPHKGPMATFNRFPGGHSLWLYKHCIARRCSKCTLTIGAFACRAQQCYSWCTTVCITGAGLHTVLQCNTPAATAAAERMRAAALAAAACVMYTQSTYMTLRQ